MEPMMKIINALAALTAGKRQGLRVLSGVPVQIRRDDQH